MRRCFFLDLTLLFVLLLTATAQAATYYVKATGNDGGSGLSDAQAWKTISKVNGFSFKAGDDVYFRCGDTWTGQFIINWSGTGESNRAVVGAYYMNGGTETIGVSGNKPVISGNNKTIPTGDLYSALLYVQGDYVTVTNLEIKQSRGRNILVHSSSSGADYVTLNNLYIHDAYGSAVYVNTGSDNCTLEYCEVYNNGYDAWAEPGNWPAVVIAWQTTNFRAHHNKIYHNWGEGLNDYNHSSGTIFEDNQVYENWAVNIYSSCTKDVIIRRNLVYNTTDTSIWRNGGNPGGIVFGSEDYCKNASYNSNIQIYDNIIANTGQNIGYWGNGGLAPLSGVKIYNNTLVEAYNPGGTPVSISLDSNITNAEIKNNIILQSTGTVASIPSSGVTCDYNLWSRQPPAAARGAHDPDYGDPQLAKTSGWSSLTAGSLKGSEFSLKANSPAIKAGTNLGAAYSTILDLDSSDYSKNETTLKIQPTDSTKWDIGADIYNSSSSSTLSAPSGLTVAGSSS
jgi:hypothetical protein